MKKKIFVTRRLLKENEEKLQNLFDVTLNKNDKIYSPQEIINGSKNYDGILSSVTDPISADTISKLSNSIKIIANGAVGFGNIDIQAAKEKGITVTNTPDVLTDATADIQILLLLGAGVVSNVNLKKGDRLKNTYFIGKSPRIGLSYEEFNNIEDKILTKDIKIGEPLLIEHFEETKFKLSKNLIKFSNDKRISLPVRLHDFKLFKDIFNFEHYEFHFSYKEIYHLAENGFSELLSIIDKSLTISIHLPDYITKDELINPFSNKSKVKDTSVLIINTCSELATEIKTKTGKECIILGSFSMNQFKTKAEFYSTFKTFIQSNEYKDNRIVAQWLPKKAWYFGGTVLVDLFCSKEDIDLCLEYDIPICLDIAHLILSANYYNENWKKWYDLLLPLCRHIHLSDAEGDDGEGVTFGKGDLHSKEEILDLDCIKVLEIWEGHHNSGKGFKEGLRYLSNK